MLNHFVLFWCGRCRARFTSSPKRGYISRWRTARRPQQYQGKGMDQESTSIAAITAASADDQGLKSARTITLVVYALQAAAFLVGVTSIVAIIINYVKRSDVQGTWLASHFRWQIRTFWFSVLWSIIGVVTTFIAVGYVILLADVIWVIYRIVKGWLRLVDNKPMYTDA